MKKKSEPISLSFSISFCFLPLEASEIIFLVVDMLVDVRSKWRHESLDRVEGG